MIQHIRGFTRTCYTNQLTYVASQTDGDCNCSLLRAYRNASVSAGLPPASQLPNPVTTTPRTTGASFVPTAVIRNMAGQRTADDKHLKDGMYSV